MTYNIAAGGVDWLVEAVAGYEPDVLALQELRGFHRDGQMDRVAELLGMRAFLARSWFGQPVAVLVRPPWRVLCGTGIRRPFHHAAAEVVVATDRGMLTVFSAHLRPSEEDGRRREADWFAARSSRVRMVLVMGTLDLGVPGYVDLAACAGARILGTAPVAALASGCGALHDGAHRPIVAQLDLTPW
jgi:exodeoxyribonuclease-3